MSLGIPGDSTTAVLISAFMLQGIQVGPLFITQNPTTWNTILIALLCCNIIMFLCMFYPIKWISKIKIPASCYLIGLFIWLLIIASIAYAIYDDRKSKLKK